jgi:hypothetical protein
MDVRSTMMALGVLLLLEGCVSVPAEAPEEDNGRRSEPTSEAAPVEAIAMDREEIIAAGLAQAIEAFRADTPLRPYAAVYSSLGGLRPVHLNDEERQASDSDTDLLLASIRTLSDNIDLQAFAVFGLAMDTQGQRWFVVHYETRQGEAQLRQYPVPPPADVSDWKPAIVEPSQAVIF